MDRKRVAWFVVAGQVALGGAIACTVTPKEKTKSTESAVTYDCRAGKRKVADSEGTRCTYRVTQLPGASAEPRIVLVPPPSSEPPVEGVSDSDWHVSAPVESGPNDPALEPEGRWVCKVEITGCAFSSEPTACPPPSELPSSTTECPDPNAGGGAWTVLDAKNRQLRHPGSEGAAPIVRGRRADVQSACETALATMRSTAPAREDLAAAICEDAKTRAQALSGPKICCEDQPGADSGYGPMRDGGSDGGEERSCPPGEVMTQERNAKICAYSIVGGSFDSSRRRVVGGSFSDIVDLEQLLPDGARPLPPPPAPEIRAELVGGYGGTRSEFRCTLRVACDLLTHEKTCPNGRPSANVARCEPSGTHWEEDQNILGTVVVPDRPSPRPVTGSTGITSYVTEYWPDLTAGADACGQKFDDIVRAKRDEGSLTHWEATIASSYCDDLVHSLEEKGVGTLTCCEPRAAVPPPATTTAPSTSPSTPPSGSATTTPSAMTTAMTAATVTASNTAPPPSATPAPATTP